MIRILLILLLFLSACTGTDRDLGQAMGYVPIYANVSNSSIGLGAVQATTHAGKIYAYGSYAFQVDQYEGIHVIANANSAGAKKIAFLKVPMCTEIAIKDHHLYTNNVNDLVVFDLSNPANPQLVKRLDNAFPQLNQEHPPFSNVYFECPDPSKGVVVGWEEKIIKNPGCRR